MMISRILTIILFLAITAELFSNFEILSPDDGIGRKSQVYANKLKVRFKPGNYNIDKINKALSEFDFKAVSQLKEPEYSHYFGNKELTGINDQKYAEIVRCEEKLLRSFILEYKGDMAPEIACRFIKKMLSEIEIAEPYYVDFILKMPNDPLAVNQLMLNQVKAISSWDKFEGDTSMIIGVLDNGLYQNHEDLQNSIAPNWEEVPNNGVDDDKNGKTDDFIGYSFGYEEDNSPQDLTLNTNDDHGSNSGGILGATYSNGKGIAGASGKSRIFPIKISSNAGWRYTPYGYQAIIYAADRGLKVINCSWGSSNSYSEINKSAVDYALAKDVAIIAAAGNGFNELSPFYPAAYFGVLGVGEVDGDDVISGTTSIGAHLHIFAPGVGNLATTNMTNGYKTVTGGTSFAAPVVSAFLGLVRAKYPFLTSIEAIEYAKQCSDDITAKNFGWDDVLPGRVNFDKAHLIEPFSIPGIKPISVKTTNTSGIYANRFREGDTLLVEFLAMNYLGDAANLRFVLSFARDEFNTATVIDSVFLKAELLRNEEFIISGYKFVLNNSFPELLFFRVDIYGENGYKDFFLMPFEPGLEVTTYENDKIKFSVSDRGKLGFGGIEDMQQGFGFILKGFDNQLYFGSGIMASANDQKVISSVHGTGYQNNDFTPIKLFVPPNHHIGSFSDDMASPVEKIGLLIETEYLVPEGDYNVAKVILKAKNISGITLENVSIAYFLDWDLNSDSKNNKVALLPEAIPPPLQSESAAAEFVEYYEQGFPVFGSAVISDYPGAVAQAAGLNFAVTNNFSKDEMLKSLNSGTTIQNAEVQDVSYVIGMRFPGEFAPNEERSFSMCFGGAANRIELAQKISECLLNTNLVENSPSDLFGVNYYPNPANDLLNISFNLPDQVPAMIEVYDYYGRILFETNVIASNGRIVKQLDISSLASGIYYFRIDAQGKLLQSTFAIVR